MKQRLSLSLLLFVVISFLLIPSVQASPQTPLQNDHVEKQSEKDYVENGLQDAVDSQLDSLNLDELKGFWEDVMGEYGGFLPESQKGSLYDFIKGEKEFSLKEWFTGILKYAFHEFVANGKLLGSLVILTIFSMFLQSLQNAFENGAISKAGLCGRFYGAFNYCFE